MRNASNEAVYRELLQNANDACAKNSKFKFNTKSSTPGLPKVKQVAFRNDGLLFRPCDWSRLRTIAERKPDFSEVGAFDVGFYSIFSVCEESIKVSEDS